MMEALVHTRIRVSEIAAGLGVSRTTLFRAFRSSGAGSPLAVLQDVRVRRAQELLTPSDQKIAAVVRACGFRDDKYFIRVFRRLTGRTPGQLRGGKKGMNGE
jgi:transcriptional regulator GlxA family with amidase domain